MLDARTIGLICQQRRHIDRGCLPRRPQKRDDRLKLRRQRRHGVYAAGEVVHLDLDCDGAFGVCYGR